jgi:hypothetical protein
MNNELIRLTAGVELQAHKLKGLADLFLVTQGDDSSLSDLTIGGLNGISILLGDIADQILEGMDKISKFNGQKKAPEPTLRSGDSEA